MTKGAPTSSARPPGLSLELGIVLRLDQDNPGVAHRVLVHQDSEQRRLAGAGRSDDQSVGAGLLAGPNGRRVSSPRDTDRDLRAVAVRDPLLGPSPANQVTRPDSLASLRARDHPRLVGPRAGG